MDAPPGAARASLAPLDAADPEPDPARSSKRSNRAGRKKRGPKTHSKTGRLNSLDAGPRASASSDDADFPTSRQPLNKHAVLGGLSGRPAQPEGVAAYADQAAAADPGLGSLSDSPGAAVSPPAYSHSPHPGGGGDPPSRADERVASKRSGRSRASGRSAGSGAGGAGEALSSISTMVAISNGVDGDGQSQQFVPDEFLARSDTLLNMSDQVQHVRLSERDRQRRNHQEIMATRQRQREMKQAETITMHTRGHDVLETKIASEKDRQLKAMQEKLKKRHQTMKKMKKRRESEQAPLPE